MKGLGAGSIRRSHRALRQLVRDGFVVQVKFLCHVLLQAQTYQMRGQLPQRKCLMSMSSYKAGVHGDAGTYAGLPGGQSPGGKF